MCADRAVNFNEKEAETMREETRSNIGDVAGLTRENRVAVPLSDKAHEHFSREAVREGRVLSRQLAW